MKFEEYLKQIGLEELVAHIKDVKLNNFVNEAFEQDLPALSKKEIEDLYVYKVPKISADGSCSIIDEPADKPYNLAKTFKIKTDRRSLKTSLHTPRLWRLKLVVKDLFDSTNVNWLGIYRKTRNPKSESVLVKESYLGLFSRPEFPLTPEFAKKSNNSTVGLTGIAKIIQDVYANSGPYYKCDGNVQSEFCLPIINSEHVTIGIIDAEAFDKNFFTNERLLQITKVAYDLGEINLGL